jgi:hypothetical protein
MSETKNQTVLKVEEEMSDITKEYKSLMRNHYDLFCNKMNNYGKNNIMLGGDVTNEEDRKLALMGVVIRMHDKINRLVNLVLKNKENTVNETTIDTLQDIVNYALIAQIINNEKWK